MTLEEHLTRCGLYRRTSGQREPTAEADFAAELKTDANLRNAVDAELARITPEVEMRCFGSRLTRSILSDIVERAG